MTPDKYGQGILRLCHLYSTMVGLLCQWLRYYESQRIQERRSNIRNGEARHIKSHKISEGFQTLWGGICTPKTYPKPPNLRRYLEDQGLWCSLSRLLATWAVVVVSREVLHSSCKQGMLPWRYLWVTFKLNARKASLPMRDKHLEQHVCVPFLVGR